MAAVALATLLTASGCGDDDAASGAGTEPPVSSRPPTTTELEIEVRLAGADGPATSVVLSCGGDDAELAGDPLGLDPAAMCRALAEDVVRRRLVEGAPPGRICTQVYGGPELATIRGTIDDTPVDTTVDRADGCGIDEWDVLLADLLPPAAGGA